MKRIISLALTILIVGCGWPVFIYAEEPEKYLSVPVEYSDNVGNNEQLEIMVKDGCVYANAEMLAERLGYSFGKEEESIVIYNTENEEIPIGFTQFSLNDTKVSHMIYAQMSDSYEAPFPSMENEEGYWIPLEYSLLILNSGLMIGDTALSIDMPHKDMVDCLYDIQKNGSTYRFDWNKDFGYTNLDVNVIGGSSHLINIFNGLLDLDGDSWAAMFQSFIMDSSAYDEKYGQNLASLLCAESQGELDASIDEIELLMDLFDEDGQLGQILSDYSLNLDAEVGVLYQNCEKILQDVQADNSSVVNYNRSYQALEKALDKQTWFSDTGGTILDVQKKLSDATSVLDVGLKVYEAVEFFHEFTNQDQFSLSALNDYLDTSVSTAVMSADMKKSMTEYSQALSNGLGDFMCKNLKDRIPSWITQGLPLSKIIGSQGVSALFAWDIVSSVVPPVSNGLEGADKFELALYAQTFQSDTFLNYQRLRDTIFANVDELSTDQLYKLSQYAYIYLKSCYATRNAALGSLEGKRESIQEQIQPLINEQNDINADIARMLVLLKAADTTNEANVYGFLPSNNEEYLKEYDSQVLLGKVEEYQSKPLSEEELLTIVESKANHGMEDHVYIDMDHDGMKELIGIYCDDAGIYQTWYCSYDGEICNLVHQNGEAMDACEIELLDVGDETHIVLNSYRMMGTGKNFSIIKLQDNKIRLLVSDQYGYVSMADGKNIVLNVEAYDGMYDPAIGGMIQHTSKNTYLFFDGNTYKEYGAVEISEQEFLNYQNAGEVKRTIEEQRRQSDTASLEFKYFKRENGIMHVQCNVQNDLGEIQYGYYTIKYYGDELEIDVGEYNPGQMEPNFSALEVEY